MRNLLIRHGRVCIVLWTSACNFNWNKTIPFCLQLRLLRSFPDLSLVYYALFSRESITEMATVSCSKQNRNCYQWCAPFHWAQSPRTKTESLNMGLIKIGIDLIPQRSCFIWQRTKDKIYKFRITYEELSKTTPIRSLHSWVISIADSSGEA